MQKHIVVIGAGFSGLSAACALAQKGFQVTVIEKNEQAGGRCSVFSESGFTFDMGPSWYWMPDVFEEFFARYRHQVSDFYELIRLDPGYRIFFSANEIIDIPAGRDQLNQLFESLEPGSSENLTVFLREAAWKYQAGMKDLVYKPCNSVFEFTDLRMVKALFSMQLFSSLRNEVYKKFKNEKIRKILEFPVYFLGALPENTPALYSILNYADLVLGTWYPKGGMYKIVAGMQSVAEELGVKFMFNSPVTGIISKNNVVEAVQLNVTQIACDGIIAAADYHHVEEQLLPPDKKNYSEKYWDKKIIAPSCIIYYLGINGKLNNLKHHNLFFDESFEQFADEINKRPQWPEKPLFYVSVPSKTDAGVAPEGFENVFVLVPVAAGLPDAAGMEDKYYDLVLKKLEQYCGRVISDKIVYKKVFVPNDFKQRYNAYKGNAYGLANTLMQTAVFKPKMWNKKLNNMVYAGQLTVPGPGVPPSIISGFVAAGELIKVFQ